MLYVLEFWQRLKRKKIILKIPILFNGTNCILENPITIIWKKCLKPMTKFIMNQDLKYRDWLVILKECVAILYRILVRRMVVFVNNYEPSGSENISNW